MLNVFLFPWTALSQPDGDDGGELTCECVMPGTPGVVGHVSVPYQSSIHYSVGVHMVGDVIRELIAFLL